MGGVAVFLRSSPVRRVRFGWRGAWTVTLAVSCTKNVSDSGAETTTGAPCPPLPQYDSKLHAKALVTGFGVREFALDVNQTGFPITATWIPEADFRLVSCAVFVCPPQIVGGELANRGECTFLYRAFEPNSATFEVSPGADMRVFAPTADPVALLVGCWAYGETEILAATRLQVLQPSLLRTAFPAASPFDAYADGCDGCDRPPCWCAYDLDTSAIGVCHSGACRERCKPEVTPTTDGAAEDSTTTGRVCEDDTDISSCYGVYVGTTGTGGTSNGI